MAEQKYERPPTQIIQEQDPMTLSSTSHFLQEHYSRMKSIFLIH